jgi:hypothetical protein
MAPVNTHLPLQLANSQFCEAVVFAVRWTLVQQAARRRNRTRSLTPEASSVDLAALLRQRARKEGTWLTSKS